jgi:superfamily II DNA or RNA helicase
MPGFISEERLTYGPWPALERAMARLLKHWGFSDVAMVGGSGDMGADVVGSAAGSRWVVQAKFRQNGLIGPDGAREAVRACGPYEASVAVAAANSGFNQDALRFAAESKRQGIDVRLWSGNHLLRAYESLPTVSKERRELREYQLDAVDEVERARSLGADRALVVMATGLGKTSVAMQVVANEVSRNPGQEVLVLAHTTDLVRQLEIASWPQLEKDCSTHLWTDGETPAYWGGVVFATWQSVMAALRRGDDLTGRFGLVVVDEAHHAPSTSFSSLLTALAPNFLLGLTATPWRADEASLTALFGEPLYTMDIVQGMQRGYLADVEYHMLTDGLDWEGISRRSEQGLTVADLNRLLMLPDRDLAMVSLVCERMREFSRPKALAFCRSIEHAERLRPLFSAQGVRAAVMHSGLPREQRFVNLTSFRSGNIDLLISVEMLNEGIDVPDVNLVAFMRVTHSRRIFLQQLGRGLRVVPGKRSVLVLDFVADVRRIAAGLSLNARAKYGASELEVVRFRDGQIVKFDTDIASRFFDKYLADVADFDNLSDGARLRFPGGDGF